MKIFNRHQHNSLIQDNDDHLIRQKIITIVLFIIVLIFCNRNILAALNKHESVRTRLSQFLHAFNEIQVAASLKWYSMSDIPLPLNKMLQFHSILIDPQTLEMKCDNSSRLQLNTKTKHQSQLTSHKRTSWIPVRTHEADNSLPKTWSLANNISGRTLNAKSS